MKTSIDVTGQKTKTKEEEEVMTLTLRQTMLFVTCTHKSLLKTGYKKIKNKKINKNDCKRSKTRSKHIKG